MIEDTPAQYRTRMQQHAEESLGAVAAAAQAAGVVCETVQVEHEHPY
jgi:nucleotide-binding universal stress UspA family protein